MQYRDLIRFLSGQFVFPVTDVDSATPSSDNDVNYALPIIIDSAEQRIYTDMDLLANREQNYSVTTTANNREITIPSNTIVVEGVAIIVGNTNPVSTIYDGKRISLENASVDFIDVCFDSGEEGVPEYYAVKNTSKILLAPTPDKQYLVEITRTYRPEGISATNTETYISKTYPQLLEAACAVAFSAYQKNYGLMGADTAQAITWEGMYQKYLASALAEEKRRRGMSITVSQSSPKPPAGVEDE